MMQRQESFEGEGKRQSTGSGQNASTLLWQRGHFEKRARCCVALCGGGVCRITDWRGGGGGLQRRRMCTLVECCA